MEAETSCQNSFETTEILATFLASTPLLEEAWKACSLANTRFPDPYLVQQIGKVAYVSFSGRQVDCGLEHSCQNLLPLDGADGGLFSPLYRYSQAEEPIRVHHGILKLFLSFYSELQNKIEALVGKVKSIVFTGHSIGGTAASLSALWLLCHQQSISSPMSVLCVTFGSPLLGNEALHRSILRQRWSGNFCHVVSKNDIMPRLLLFTEIVNHISIIQSLLHFWHCCMASPHVIADALCSHLSQDLQISVFQCVLKDLEVLEHAEDLSAMSLFWPFGGYVFCSLEGAICVENAASVIRMMYLMMAMASPSRCIEDHLKYGDYVRNVSKQVLKTKNFHENGNDLPDSSSEAGLELALQSSDLTEKEPVQFQDLCFSMQNSNQRENVANMAKECLQMGQSDQRPYLALANLAIRLSKIVPFRVEIEWYKAKCDEADDQLGYYDSFKRRTGSKKEAWVNMNRFKLASFWDSVIDLYENNKLPHDFDTKGKWINTSQSYKLLVEPLDIADYYRTGMHLEHGHYIENGRKWRYEVFDKLWRIRSLQIEEKKRSKFASVTQDSLFWAKVEEASEWVDNVRSESDVTKLNQLWHKIDKFEKHAMKLIENKEVSKDVMFKNSSFSRWMGKWNELKPHVRILIEKN